MTKGKLIELLKKYQRREITSDDIVSLKGLTDEEIDIVLKTNNKTEIINLLTNEIFKTLPEAIKKEIIEILITLKEGSIHTNFIIKAATNKNIIESGNLLEIIRLIVKQKNLFIINYILTIASNQNTIISDKVLEICKLISKYGNKPEQLKIATFAATDVYITRSGNVLKVVESILSAPDKESALNKYYGYVNRYKKLTAISALSKEYIKEIDFWNLLSEDPETAINLIVQIDSNEEIGLEEKITMEQLGISRTKKK